MSTTIHDTDLLALARGYAADPDAWPVAPRFNPARRWYHLLDEGGGYQVWLLSWLPGQHTDLHDHGGSAGAFVVVSGELTEHSVEETLVERRLPAGQGRRFDGHHVHRITNNGQRPAVSVHVYGPALQTMTRYRYEDGALTPTSVDRAGAQW